jgi:hypothetical protein
MLLDLYSESRVEHDIDWGSARTVQLVRLRSLMPAQLITMPAS